MGGWVGKVTIGPRKFRAEICKLCPRQGAIPCYVLMQACTSCTSSKCNVTRVQLQFCVSTAVKASTRASALQILFSSSRYFICCVCSVD